MTGTITQVDVDRSYDLVALLEVCKGAAEQLRDGLPSGDPQVQLAGALPGAIEQAIDKWSDVHNALEVMMMAVEDKPVPEPAAKSPEFDNIFAAWNTNRRQQQDVSDEEAERLNKQELKLLDKIVTTPARNHGEIAAKVFVAKKLIEESGSRWSDERDLNVIESVLEDLTRLGASKPTD